MYGIFAYICHKIMVDVGINIPVPWSISAIQHGIQKITHLNLIYIFAEAMHPAFYRRQVANALLSIKGTVHDQMSLLDVKQLSRRPKNKIDLSL